ncbi:MAG TPA: alpha/beta fold hydrolase [Acidimicrobiales bacterium]|nr:alpha/beta fold hydrolase [Acidimicrobiales bacterium]
MADPPDSSQAPAGGFDRDDPPVLGANPFVGLTRRQVGAALSRLLGRVAVEPGVVVTGAFEAARQLLEVALGRSELAPDPSDKRFVDPAWASNPLYRRLLQAYLVERDALFRLIDEVGLDPKSRERARFAMSLVTEAAAPTNTLLGNPSALGKAWQTRGQSLAAGLRHFRHDLRHNGGMPSMVDTRPFKVGENVAVTPGEVIHRSELFELIQYAPVGSRTFRRPLVAVPPQINKYYISDLAPGRSFVEHAVAAGIPYFAVSWRNPTPAQRDWDLAAYVSACKEAVEVACDVSAASDANVAGMCAGGITLACLLGHLAATDESLVNSATFMVAGLDISSESTVGLLTSTTSIEAARARSQRRGVLDGRDLGRMFAWLRPNDLVWNYWVNNYLLGQNPPAFDILDWNADTTNLAAGLHSDFLDLLGSNGLAHAGSLEVLGTTIDLGKVRCDAYVVAGATDHIIPWTAAYQTTQMLGGDSEFVLGSSGHIQAIVNPPGNKRSKFLTRAGPAPPDPLEWRAGATTNEGSWWDHWLRWLSERSGDDRRAPAKLGNRRHPPIEAAPGRYVHL